MMMMVMMLRKRMMRSITMIGDVQYVDEDGDGGNVDGELTKLAP